MNQFMHTAVAMIIWFTLWHCYLKNTPKMKTKLRRFTDWFKKFL